VFYVIWGSTLAQAMPFGATLSIPEKSDNDNN